MQNLRLEGEYQLLITNSSDALGAAAFQVCQSSRVYVFYLPLRVNALSRRYGYEWTS